MIKTIKNWLSALLLILFMSNIVYSANNTATSTQTNTKDPGGIEAYYKENFGGNRNVLAPGIYNLDDIPEVKSLKIPKGYEVLLSNSEDFKSPDNASLPDVEKDSSSECSSIDRQKYKYLYVAKLDIKQESGIAPFARLDKESAVFRARGQINISDFGNVNDVNEVIIDSSPKLSSIPKLDRYKNLHSLKFMVDTLSDSTPEALTKIVKNIVDFTQNVHPFKRLKFQGIGPKTITFPNIFVGINLTSDEELMKRVSVRELYLIDCDIKQIPDLSKFWNLKKLYLYGTTFKQATEQDWNNLLSSCNRTGVTHLILPEGFAAPLKSGLDSVEYLIAPGVKEIADKAFASSASKLKSISCDSVVTVGEQAFKGHKYLKVADFPRAQEIKGSAFESAYELSIVNIPRVKTIGCRAFMMSGKANLQIGDVLMGVKKLRLKEAAIMGTQRVNENDGFIYLPECERVGFGAFCSAPSSAQYLGVCMPKCLDIGGKFGSTDPKLTPHGSFVGCQKLRNVYLDAAINIYDSSFEGCTSIECLYIPNVEIIGKKAFYSCYSLKNVVGKDNLHLRKVVEIGESAFWMPDKHPCQIKSVELPMVESIGEDAFSRWRSMENLTLKSCRTIGKTAFYDAYKLKKLSLPAVETIGERAFIYNRQSLSGTLSFPKCKKIGSKAFGGDGWAYNKISRVDINACTDCADDAFIGCSSLKTLNAGKLSKGKRNNILKQAKKRL